MKHDKKVFKSKVQHLISWPFLQKQQQERTNAQKDF